MSADRADGPETPASMRRARALLSRQEVFLPTSKEVSAHQGEVPLLRIVMHGEAIVIRNGGLI